jgi:hypothetical protein
MSYAEVYLRTARRAHWEVDLEVCLVVTDVDLSLVASYPYGDPNAVEVLGTRACHNICGLLDPSID